MIVRTLVKPKTYRDSVELMSLSAAVKALPGIDEVAVIMGTERNKASLDASNLLVGEAAAAKPNDLVAVVRGTTEETVAQALSLIKSRLAQTGQEVVAQSEREWPKSIAAAVRERPGSNVALISVPGSYAASEAFKALRSGLHVMIFSDNVSIEEEVRLKRLGRELGLLVMGPDCGTSIINGALLGFANVVSRGTIGVVGASGTGIQQVTSLIDRLGLGITHAIGTGGRDLADEVGGVTTLIAIDALEQDPDTRVLVVISKPAGKITSGRVLGRLRQCSKPVVVCILGGDLAAVEANRLHGAKTLEDAATLAVSLARGAETAAFGDPGTVGFPRAGMEQQIREEVAKLTPNQKYLRGLYAGGTLADEAMYVVRPLIGDVYSNMPIREEFRLPDVNRSLKHCVVDMGDDAFTLGRPHPMIDPSMRTERLLREAADPEVAVILCDVVLGYGSQPNPAGVLASAIEQARQVAGDRHIAFVASVCGSKRDPQKLDLQEQILRDSGALVFPTNAYAAEVAGMIGLASVERRGS